MVSIILVYGLISSCCLPISTPYFTRGPFNKEDNDTHTGNSITNEPMSLASEHDSLQYNIEDSGESSNDKQFTNNLSAIRDSSDDYGLNISDIIIRQFESFGLSKRQVCNIPPTTLQDMIDLYQHINSSVFFTKLPDTIERVKIPANQLLVCPERLGDYHEATDLNSLAICPWKIDEHDMGMGAFPRYLPGIRCLCERCFGFQARRCEENESEKHYFRFRECKKGFAMFTREHFTLGSSCFCRTAPVQGATLVPNFIDE